MTMNMYVGAAVAPIHPHDWARLLERARILLSGCCEELIRAEAFEPDATGLVDELDHVLPRLRGLIDRYDPVEDSIPF